MRPRTALECGAGGLAQLRWILPRVAAVAGGLFAGTLVWTRLVPHHEPDLVLPVRAVLLLLGCVLMWSLTAPKQSATSRFLRTRTMTFFGTYSYGLYVYRFISYYFSSNHTEFELARLIGSHGAAVALQATTGMAASLAIAYLSYELIERRFLRLKRLFTTAHEPARQRKVAGVATGP